ncbi:hypothetical protein T4B_10375, partial [Trichinella pseudospiralis]
LDSPLAKFANDFVIKSVPRLVALVRSKLSLLSKTVYLACSSAEDSRCVMSFSKLLPFLLHAMGFLTCCVESIPPKGPISPYNSLESLFGGTFKSHFFIPTHRLGDVVNKTSDLNCANFNSSCLWRNDHTNDDDFKWAVGSGQPDIRKFRFLMRSTVLPGGNDGTFAILRTTQPQPANRQAMLVSNVILCQTAPGTLSFRFWSSPRVLLKICTRSPNAGTYFHKCFDFERREGGSLISVPVQYPYMRPFEIVFVASNFIIRSRRRLAGVVIIDDITYYAPICNRKTIRNFKRPTSKPRTIQPEKLFIKTSFDQERFEHACEQLQCSFNEDESGSQPCTNYLLRNVKVTSGKSGNRHTGISAAYCNFAPPYRFIFWCNIVFNLPCLAGPYGYVTGPGNVIMLQSHTFQIPKKARLRFCYNAPDYESRLTVETFSDEGKQVVFESPVLNIEKLEKWKCVTPILNPGNYNTLEFKAKKLRNEYSYLAIDEIALVDVNNGTTFC